MAIKEIRERANKQRRRYDHIGWRAICKRCGHEKNILGDEIRKTYGDGTKDLWNEEWECSSPRCKGRVKVLKKMPPTRALHLADILRRT